MTAFYKRNFHYTKRMILCICVLFFFTSGGLIWSQTDDEITAEDAVQIYGILTSAQDPAELHLYKEGDEQTYKVCYSGKDDTVYFFQLTDVASDEKKVCAFGGGFKFEGTPMIGLKFNTMSVLDLMGQEKLTVIGTLAWTQTIKLDNDKLPYAVDGYFIPSDKKSEQLFKLFVLDNMEEYNNN
jgi:hypothetical protein